jgi:hypothetical protein
MSDPDRERIVVEETPPRVERETTVITTGDGGGGGGTIIAVLLVLIVAVLLFLYFGDYLGGASDEIDLNVNVDAPKVEAPDIDINVPPPAETSNKSGG